MPASRKRASVPDAGVHTAAARKHLRAADPVMGALIEEIGPDGIGDPRRGVRPEGQHEREQEGEQPEHEADRAEVGRGLHVGILDAPLVVARREGEGRDVRKLPVCGRQLWIDRRGLVRRLPAGTGGRMVTPDQITDVREQRVLRVRLDVRVLGLLALQVEKTQKVLEVAGA